MGVSRRTWSLVLGLALLGGSCGGPAQRDAGACQRDNECNAGEVCARDGDCWPPSQVRPVRITWTLRSQAANAQSCANSPDLDLEFFSRTASFGFSPVPCIAGMFTVDKLPFVYTTVELERDGEVRHDLSAAFDSAGNAAIDLPF